MEKILEALNWRYAVKQFDKTKKLSPEQVSFLKQVVNLTPSSMGLQPYRVVIIENEEIRQELIKASYGQAQITTASHLFLFCAKKNIDNAYADTYLNKIAYLRKQSRESLKSYESMIKAFTSQPNDETKTNWAAKQSYIAAGNLLSICAINQIDACPMEGFEAEKYSAILELNQLNLTPTVLVAIGYRSEEDKYANAEKVRIDLDEMFIQK